MNILYCYNGSTHVLEKSQHKGSNMKIKKSEMQDPIEIAGVTIEPGTIKTVHIRLAMIPGHPAFTLNLRVIHGYRPGKRLFISSTIHGDELNGIETIHRVLASPLTHHLRGTLIAIPIVNTIGMLTQSRYLPDRRDLNRSFPGSETGSAAGQLAHVFLTEVVKKCTHGIDLHTGSNNRTNLPQVRCDFQSADSLKLALAFGAQIILKAKLRDGSLREAAEALGIPTITFEGGEALRFNEVVTRTAIQGIFRVLRSLGMIPSDKNPHTRKESAIISPMSRWLRAPDTGIFRTKIGLGNKVFKGDVIGTISDSLGLNYCDVTASFDGIVVGMTQLPLVYKGDALFNIAWVADPEKAEATIEELTEETELNPSLEDPITY